MPQLLIALDLDNTVCDFTGGFSRWLRQLPEFANRELPPHADYDLVKSGWFNSTEEFLHYFKAAEADGLYGSLRPIQFALAALRELANADRHLLKVVTARGAEHTDETQAWLNRYDIPFHSIVHTEAKELEEADLFIDDAPSQIAKLFGQRELLVPTMPYNKHLAYGAHFSVWWEVPFAVASMSRGRRLPRVHTPQLASSVSPVKPFSAVNAPRPVAPVPHHAPMPMLTRGQLLRQRTA